MKKTKERHYQVVFEQKYQSSKFGLMSGHTWYEDPKRLTFILARYKFISKMLAGSKRVLEIGCSDGFGARVVRREVGYLMASDFDSNFIKNAKKILDPNWTIDFKLHDMIKGSIHGKPFNAAYSCDVLEHIPKKFEDRFIKNICNSLLPEGVLIIGTPSLESQAYASSGSKLGHVNCKTEGDLRELMRRHFHNVFIFSMNDEIVHTGFHAMAHYRFALCCYKKSIKD